MTTYDTQIAAESIVRAAGIIAERKLALRWLKKYGDDLLKDSSNVRVGLHVQYASARDGYSQAVAVMKKQIDLTDVVSDAIVDCVREIKIQIDTIRELSSKLKEEDAT